jgi:hypothetical protein
MQNRPTKEELLEGVSRFLREEAVQKLEGREQFHARVAARAAEMVLRELRSEGDALRLEAASLIRLLGLGAEEVSTESPMSDQLAILNRKLVARISAGEADAGDFRRATIDHLKRVTIDRLAVNNPQMAEVVRTEFGL